MVGAGVAGGSPPQREDHAFLQAEVDAFLELKGVPGLGDRGIRQLVDVCGTGEAALATFRRQGGPEAFRKKVRKGRRVHAPAEDLPSWDRGAYRILPMTSPDYPAVLHDLVDPPPLLFLRGREDLLYRPAVAVVGARRATEVGRRTAEALGRVLGEAGVTVVSGMALGIDGAAHRGALAVGGDTLAVLGSGLARVHPPSHRGLSREIGKMGLLVSEFLPPEASLPHHFPRRNRIIAALVRAVVVVEAGEKSGALITVDHALDLGREIFAVPGSVESPLARGTNALLGDGARAVPHPEAILPVVGELFPDLKREGGGGAGEGARSEAAVPRELRPLFAGLSTEPRTAETLAREAGLDSGRVLAGLLALELGGWAVQCPGLRFRRQDGVG